MHPPHAPTAGPDRASNPAAAAGLPAGAVSVVLPYYENQRTLGPCLAALAAQTLVPWEVVVVDDGSAHPAQPVVDAFVAATPPPYRLRLIAAAHAGQSAATNAGIMAAVGDVILLTCADIIAEPQLVATHAGVHAAAADEVAVAGYLPYHDSVKMTPFMRYLAETDVQFSFAHIGDRENISFLACYAPNFSARRSTLQAIGGFDEAFVYGYQDTDLGKRLAYSQVRFVYRQEAVGYHDHPTHLRAFIRRQRRVGEATLTWLEKWHDLEEKAKMRQVVEMYTPFLASLETSVADIEQLEALMEAKPYLWPRAKQKIYSLYNLVNNTAVVAGMVAQSARLQRALDDHAHLGPRARAPAPGHAAVDTAHAGAVAKILSPPLAAPPAAAAPSARPN